MLNSGCSVVLDIIPLESVCRSVHTSAMHRCYVIPRVCVSYPFLLAAVWWLGRTQLLPLLTPVLNMLSLTSWNIAVFTGVGFSKLVEVRTTGQPNAEQLLSASARGSSNSQGSDTRVRTQKKPGGFFWVHPPKKTNFTFT